MWGGGGQSKRGGGSLAPGLPDLPPSPFSSAFNPAPTIPAPLHIGGNPQSPSSPTPCPPPPSHRQAPVTQPPTPTPCPTCASLAIFRAPSSHTPFFCMISSGMVTPPPGGDSVKICRRRGGQSGPGVLHLLLATLKRNSATLSLLRQGLEAVKAPQGASNRSPLCSSPKAFRACHARFVPTACAIGLLHPPCPRTCAG